MKIDIQSYSELLSKIQNPDEIINDMKVVYNPHLYESTGRYGQLVPIVSTWKSDGQNLKPDNIKDWYVVIDQMFKYVPPEVKGAIVDHEKIHKEYNLDDSTDDTMKLVVNTLAFIESQNPFCSGISYICREIRKLKKSGS